MTVSHRLFQGTRRSTGWLPWWCRARTRWSFRCSSRQWPCIRRSTSFRHSDFCAYFHLRSTGQGSLGTCTSRYIVRPDYRDYSDCWTRLDNDGSDGDTSGRIKGDCRHRGDYRTCSNRRGSQGGHRSRGARSRAGLDKTKIVFARYSYRVENLVGSDCKVRYDIRN